MRVVLTGPKGTGKSTVGQLMANWLSLRFIDLDHEIESIYRNEEGTSLTFREIYHKKGETAFRELECRACEKVQDVSYCVIATGGGTVLFQKNRQLLGKNSVIVSLKASDSFLWERISSDGLPEFLQGSNGRDLLGKKNSEIYEVLERFADTSVDVEGKAPDEIVDEIMSQLALFLGAAAENPNSFGSVIRSTTFGESHGAAVGVVLDGLPAGLPVDGEMVQREMERRRPGQSQVTTARNEKDSIKFLSGVFEGKTTGTPLCMVVYNDDQNSSAYDSLREVFRPGHADFTFWKKFGLRDHRGGGRSSGRETIGRVASGAVIRQFLSREGIIIRAYASEIAGIRGTAVDYDHIERNSVRSADPEVSGLMEKAVLRAKEEKDSVGGIVTCSITGLEAGVGDPVFMKLDARLAHAFFSIGAVKGVEIGAGFRSALMKGSAWNDPMDSSGFKSNNAGGILGGISTGEEIIAHVAVKPTPSIASLQHTVDLHGHDRELEIHGRHDPCIIPRIIPVIEAMAALVIYDALAIQRKLQENRPF